MTRENGREPGQPEDRASLVSRALIFALLAAAGLVLLYRPRSRNPALATAWNVAAPGLRVPPERGADRESEHEARTVAAEREKPDVRAGILATILAGFLRLRSTCGDGAVLLLPTRAPATRALSRCRRSRLRVSRRCPTD